MDVSSNVFPDFINRVRTVQVVLCVFCLMVSDHKPEGLLLAHGLPMLVPSKVPQQAITTIPTSFVLIHYCMRADNNRRYHNPFGLLLSHIISHAVHARSTIQNVCVTSAISRPFGAPDIPSRC